LGIPLSFGFSISNGVVQGGGGFEINFPDFVFSGFSTDDGDQKVVHFVFQGGLVFVQDSGFFFGSLQPSNQIPGGFNFVFFQVSHRFFNVFFQFINSVQQFLSNVSFVSTSSHSFQLQSSLRVIISVFVPFSSFGIYFLGFVLSQLVEGFHSLFIKQVFVSGQFAGRVFNLNQFFFRVVVSDNSHDVLSQPSNNGQGFVVFSQSFNEHE